MLDTTYIWRHLLAYLWNLLRAADQVLNTILGGDPREELSSRMGKYMLENKCILCKYVCRLLDIFQFQHCEKSIDRSLGSEDVLK
jgi:hypothetical protein